LFKLIFYLLLFYFGFKIYKYFKRVFFTTNNSSSSSKIYKKKDENIKINSEDIIEADFEEIEEPKQKENNN